MCVRGLACTELRNTNGNRSLLYIQTSSTNPQPLLSKQKEEIIDTLLQLPKLPRDGY